MTDYDLAVIGAGPGGYLAALYANQLGLKVVCIEKGTVGGTCLHVGCIPSKTLLHFTDLYAQLLENRTFIPTSTATVDFAALQAHKQKVIGSLSSAVSYLFSKNGVDLVTGKATLTSAHTIQVEGFGKEISAKNILLATGSLPIELPFLPFDEKKILSSTGALNLAAVPSSMLVVGAGVIGVELASVYARLGTKVRCVELLPTVCAGLDAALSQGLLQALKKQKIEFLLSTQVMSGKVSDKGVTLELKGQDGERASCTSDVVLVAIGRRSATKELGLEAAGVKVEKNGSIQVDGSFRTSVPSIYAIGDLIEGSMLAHRATEEGIAVCELLAGKKAAIEYMSLPNVIYTFPECATVGLTEEEVKKSGRPYKTATAYLKGNPRALASGYQEGFAKVIADAKTELLLGLHILSPQASEMISIGMVAISKKMKASELAFLPFPHPTLSECIKEACLQILRK
jgi:dihydrolipoamide dehydrogenase